MSKKLWILAFIIASFINLPRIPYALYSPFGAGLFIAEYAGSVLGAAFIIYSIKKLIEKLRD